jgi:hypothetical protein
MKIGAARLPVRIKRKRFAGFTNYKGTSKRPMGEERWALRPMEKIATPAHRFGLVRALRLSQIPLVLPYGEITARM